jgi:hypothetical protein
MSSSAEWTDLASRTYVDNSVHYGERSLQQRVQEDAEMLYNLMVCDLRYGVDDVCKMIQLHAKERNS